MIKNLLGKKIIVVTGASKGLGNALASSFSNPGNILILCSKNIKELKTVCNILKNKGADCYPFKVDVSKKKDTINFIRKILKKFEKIDILINNAGTIHKAKPLEKITDKEYSQCLKTNLDSVFYTLREIIPSMITRKSGAIVTISSMAGKRGNPDFAAYSTSKFAVTGLMQSTARYLDKYGVRCLTILPGGMNTDMRKYILGTSDAKKQQSPVIVAQIIKKIVESEIQFPNGSEIEIRDGKII